MTAGRPPIVTPEILDKLEYAFSLGCTDLEACLFADISKSTLYNYQNENPAFVERKEELKENPPLQARKVVMEAIAKGNLDTARWYLERKKKNEFSTRVESTGEDGNPIVGATIDFSKADDATLRRIFGIIGEGEPKGV